MSPFGPECAVPLEQLDDHLKRIVKLKIREFIHLSPWFNDIPSIDLNHYMRLESLQRATLRRESPLECPNTHRAHSRKRVHRPGSR
ncbi:MAG TPA: hypothetical protein V6C72_02225 [Chroococcales cyanobacterium]